jgi:hypothetical protein
MVFKPMEESTYMAYLKMVGWRLSKAGIDYSLFDEHGVFICTIKINHGKGKKREVIAPHVQKTEKKFKEKGLKWPPQKKSKSI